MALYEDRPNIECKKLDFAIWIPGFARYGMQVKGGTNRVHKGVWYFITPAGEERKGSPLKQAWDSTMGLHDHLKNGVADKRNPFIVPVIVLPDMERDEDIESWTLQSGVRVLWGTDNLVERLIELADTCNFFYPPTAEEIAEEVKLVIPGLGYPGPDTRRRQQLRWTSKPGRSSSSTPAWSTSTPLGPGRNRPSRSHRPQGEPSSPTGEDNAGGRAITVLPRRRGPGLAYPWHYN